jgi:hypothetical protein
MMKRLQAWCARAPVDGLRLFLAALMAGSLLGMGGEAKAVQTRSVPECKAKKHICLGQCNKLPQSAAATCKAKCEKIPCL